jgi:hypothetical protein
MGALLVLNISLLFSILIGPAFLLVAHWYRASLGRPLMEWPRQEMVMATILSAVTALILLAIGVSCFFTYLGFIDIHRLPSFFHRQYFHFGLSCVFFISGLTMCYLALRRVLVQLVLPQGVMLHKGVLPMPRRSGVVAWSSIVDYYVQSDYPNTVFTLMVKESDLKYQRMSLRVPIYLKDEFQQQLDAQMGTASAYSRDSQLEGEFSTGE